MSPKQHLVWYRRGLRHYNNTLHEPLFLMNDKNERTMLSAGVYIIPTSKARTACYIGVENSAEGTPKPPKGEAEFQDLSVLPFFDDLPEPDDEYRNVVLTTQQFHEVLRQTARREAQEEVGIELQGQLRFLNSYKYQPGTATMPRVYYLFDCKEDRSFDELCASFLSNEEVRCVSLRDPHKPAANRFDRLYSRRRPIWN